MRIIVFADTHGNFSAANQIFTTNKLISDHFIFLGDGMEEIEHIKSIFPEKKIYCVSGNCDRSNEPVSRTIEVFNTRIFMTHGHYYDVRNSFDKLIDRAKEENASVILFAHTHCRYYSFYKGYHILNPGSAAQPKDQEPPAYAVIDLTPCGINFMHVDV